MGHWLDGLLAGSVKIEWDGVTMPSRSIVAFSEQFTLADDPLGDKTHIELRFMGLDGDVTGDSDENRVTTISGDEEGATVEMRALSLAWDPSVSEGEAELAISGGELDAGAIAIRHGFQDVFVGVSNAPRIGNSTAVAQLIGGQRFSTRVVNTSAVTLDATSKDMLVHVNASGERSITLPAASEGRTIIFMIAGPSVVTIKRAGAELINGAAGNYIVPFADACVVLSSVGGNWVARSFADAAGLGGTEAEVPITRRIDTIAPLTGGGDVSADRTLGLDMSAFVPPARLINATPPLTGGGNLSSDLTLGLDASGLVASSRSIATVAPLLGGGPLTTDRTIGIDPAAYVAPLRSVATTAPLMGGGDLSADRTLSIDPAGFVPPARTITVTAPLTGGGDLSANRTIGINTSAFVGATRSIATTAPLTGGGDLSVDRTLAISSATAAALGVLQLAGNLGGTAVAPFVTGARADSITIQNADGSNKGVWSTVGLRIGDATAPTQKLEVVGTALATGDIIANGAANGKARLAGVVGSTATHGGVYLGNVTPGATNYTLQSNGTNQTDLNVGAGGTIQLITNGTAKLALRDSAGQVNSLGGSSQTTQFVGGQIWTVKAPAITADYTMAAGDLVIPVDTTAAIRSVTLPSPQAGRSVIIKRRAGTNRVTINIGGSNTVDGAAVSDIFLLTGSAVPGMQPFIWLIGDSTGTTGWLIVSYYSIQINLP